MLINRSALVRKIEVRRLIAARKGKQDNTSACLAYDSGVLRLKAKTLRLVNFSSHPRLPGILILPPFTLLAFLTDVGVRKLVSQPL